MAISSSNIDFQIDFQKQERKKNKLDHILLLSNAFHYRVLFVFGNDFDILFVLTKLNWGSQGRRGQV